MITGSDLVIPNLLADLHVHLLGTGDTDFWWNQLNDLPSDDLLKGSTSEPVPVKSLLNNKEMLREHLLIPNDFPPGQHDVFGRYMRLRQSIAKENPEALKDLIVWNTERYKIQGIYYVEFSVGVGWLCSSQIAAALREGIELAFSKYGVYVRILLAFNRKNTSKEIHNERFLERIYDDLSSGLGPCEQPEHFKHQLDLLRNATGFIENGGLSGYVVGYDYMGDERNSPYPPFLLPEFKAFFDRQRKNNHRFGIRLHAGELMFPSTKAGYSCLRITQHFLEYCFRNNMPTRIGHGMGAVLLKDTLWKKWVSLYGKKLARYGWEICNETLRTSTMEICLISNRILVGVRPENNPVIYCLKRPFYHCVLATDDPHVFGDGFSLNDEFQVAISSKLITTQQDITRLVKESLQGSFAPPDIIEAINKQIGSNIYCLPEDQEPPDNTIETIQRKIRYFNKPHRAIEQIEREERTYRRSQKLWDLRFEADEALRHLNASEGFYRNYGDWEPPALR